MSVFIVRFSPFDGILTGKQFNMRESSFEEKYAVEEKGEQEEEEARAPQLIVLLPAKGVS